MIRSTLISFSVIALGLAALPASAQSLSEGLKVAPADAARLDLFGSAVAISGNTAIVGAPDGDAGIGFGCAYLFDTANGQQLFKLTADDAAPGDGFGTSVAISGTTAIVGAIYDSDAGTFSGSAYLFDTTTGQQLFKLTANDAAPIDVFGKSVAISGTTAIVGASADDDAGTGSGSAYLFDTANGQQLFKLTADDAAMGDSFGASVAISGTTAIVGARSDDDPGSSNHGSAYLFDTTTGQQIFKLTADDAAEEDGFGWPVAISGTTAIIGAIFDDDAIINSGSAYLFDTTTGQQLFKLAADDAASGDWFGGSVAIFGATAIVGAQHDDDAGSSSGSAYLFDTASGQQLFKLAASDAARNDRFGRSVAISSTTAIVGAPLDDDAGSSSGSAYLFTTRPCNAADLIPPYGTLNTDDIDTFIAAFIASDLGVADCDANGLLSVDDIDCFVAAFLVGCP